MSRRISLLLLLFVAGFAWLACEDVPVDDSRADSRLFPPRGVVKGSILYQGPHPCSSQGHVLGSAILLFFAKDNPPPPAGLANTAVNFGVVEGDAVFPDEPRYPGAGVYCPKDHGKTDTITVTAPFTVSPFDAGTYILLAFFDYRADFLPTFKFRNLPELGDIAGGYVDTADAQKHAGDANYQPHFLPIDVGVPPADGDAGAPLVMPPAGYVADGIPVTLGLPVALTRPYFYPSGGEAPSPMPVPTPANPSADPSFVPVVQMAQDIHVDAPPAFPPSAAAVATLQGTFPIVKLVSGVPVAEQPIATDPAEPFHFQIGPSPKGLFVWNSGQTLPEGNGVPLLYPLVVFTKLVDDPDHTGDPQSIRAQGGPSGPIVVILGITLSPSQDSLYDTTLSPPGPQPAAATAADHVSALVRPSALCIDPTNIAAGATLVTPYLFGPSADPTEKVPPGGKPLFDPAGVKTALAATFGKVTIKQGCLPPGRYAINAVYPDGQAWTTPNEAGSCAPAEGTIDLQMTPPACTTKPRRVLYSQGTRAVLEVTAPATPSAICQQFPVPTECGGP